MNLPSYVLTIPLSLQLRDTLRFQFRKCKITYLGVYDLYVKDFLNSWRMLVENFTCGIYFLFFFFIYIFLSFQPLARQAHQTMDSSEISSHLQETSCSVWSEDTLPHNEVCSPDRVNSWHFLGIRTKKFTWRRCHESD